MTAKEQVLNVYPTAQATGFTYGGQRLWAVKYRTEKGMQSWDTPLAEDYTQDRVWESAWKRIQNDMLDKLAE